MTNDPAIAEAMTLVEAEECARFRQEARDWLAEHRPRGALAPAYSSEGFEQRRSWERQLFEADWAAVHWPRTYGGRDASIRESAIFAEEYLASGAPDRINGLGLNLFGPALLVFGTDAQRARWLPGILRCDDIWCQGFSEPDAGSDLAGLRTTARLDGDCFVVDGQKIWTSLAGFGDWIFALVRTDPDAPKHRGISMLAIDLHSDGIDIRPLRQIDGDPSFAEVFFDEVRVPAEHLVGELNDGWRVAMHALGLERGSSFGAHVGVNGDVDQLVSLRRVRDRSLAEGTVDPSVDGRMARAFARAEAYRAMCRRMLTRSELGVDHPAEPSIAKLFRTELRHEIYDLGLTLLGEFGELDATSEEIHRRFGADLVEVWEHWHHEYWYARAAKIFAGTSEVQRNIIAERRLGLPKEAQGAARAGR